MTIKLEECCWALERGVKALKVTGKYEFKRNKHIYDEIIMIQGKKGDTIT